MRFYGESFKVFSFFIDHVQHHTHLFNCKSTVIFARQNGTLTFYECLLFCYSINSVVMSIGQVAGLDLGILSDLSLFIDGLKSLQLVNQLNVSGKLFICVCLH